MAPQTIEVYANQVSNRLDVHFYIVRAEVQRRMKRGMGVPLTTLCNRIRTQTPPREAYLEEGLSGVPCIKLRNVTGRGLSLSNCDYIPERLAKGLVYAQKYDLILTATGEGTVGRVDIFVEEGRYVVTGENILLRPELEAVNPFYLLVMLRTPFIRRQITAAVRGATGQTHLYWQDIAEIRVPLASSRKREAMSEVVQKSLRMRRESEELLTRVEEEGDRIILGVTNP